ncbi:MAG: SusC/RagA family TonB-linked outer membrane protein [Chitinophagaceae bacterium]
MKRKLTLFKPNPAWLLAIFTVLLCVSITHAQDVAASNQPAKKNTTAKSQEKLKAVSLQDLMLKLQKTYGLYFSYQADALKETMVVYSEGEEKEKGDAGAVLKKVLTPAGLTFEKVNNVYIIKQAGVINTVYAPEPVTEVTDFPVSGVVTDANGPVTDATITEKGTNNITKTNNAGRFSINVAGPNAILVISHVGYTTNEVPVGGLSQVSVVLTGSSRELEQVVVTALGITRSKKSLGYSVGTIKGEDMNRVSQTNVLNSMAGKVSGVTISSTGSAATSSVSMVIRGMRSLNNDNQPLFVIDGVPVQNSMNNITSIGNGNDVDYGNAISDINPNDIESVSILKGPSAAALYGSRAGNGVVLITTKSGKKSKGIGVTFSSNTEFDKPYKYLPVNTDYSSGSRPYTEAYPGNDPLTNIGEMDTYRYGIPLNQGIKAIQWNSPMDANGNYIPTDMVGYPNNLKNFVQTGITSQNSLSIENATDKDNYRFSYSNTTNSGVIPKTDLQRHNLALNVEHKLNKDLRISTSLNYTRSSSTNVVAGNVGTNPLEDVIYLSPSVNINDLRNYWLQQGTQQKMPLAPGTDPSSSGIGDNPWFLINQVKNGFLRNRLFGNIRLDYQFSPHLSAFLRYSQDLLNEQRETKISKSYHGDRNGAYGIQKIYGSESNTDFLVSYKNKVSAFDVSASVGGNIQYSYGSNITNKSKNGSGIITPEFFNISNIAPTALDYSAGYSQYAVYSLYATASLGFKDMAYLDLTGRNDWSSTLPKSENSYFYPSVSLSLLINNIANLGDNISLFKIRGGWANVGKGTSPYNLLGTIGQGNFGGVTTMATSAALKNPTLKPEQAQSTEFGLDFNMFKNRLRFEGTIYQSDNRDQVLGISTPISSGYSSRQINAGLVRSKGIELSLGGTIIQNKDWQWDLSVNYTKNNSYIISLADGVPYFSFWQDGNSGSWTYAKGNVIPGAFHSDGSPVISDGKLGQLWDNTLATVTDKSSPYYNWPLLDADGFLQYVGNKAFNTKQAVGNYNPKLLMGMQTSVSYKRFTLTASLDMRLGGTFFSQTYRYLQSDAVMKRQENMGIPIPEANKNDIPAYLKSNPDKFIKFSGYEQFHVVGGPTAATGGFPYSDGTTTLNDGMFVPGVYQDDNGNYVENLGGPDTKYDYYADGVTNNWNFARMSMFDASYIKLRELTLSANLPQSWSNSLKLQGISFGIYTRNILLWTKAKAGIDPELAFQFQSGAQGNGSQFRNGIERFNVTPWTIPIGLKLNVRF